MLTESAIANLFYHLARALTKWTALIPLSFVPEDV